MKLSKGFIYTVLASLCWALSIIFTKVSVKSGENIYNILFWISVISIPYWIFIFSRQREEFKKITKKDYTILLSMGFISGLLISIIEMFALKNTTTTNYSFLIRTTILFTIVLAYLFLGEKINLKKIIIAVMILIGAFLLVTEGKMMSFGIGDILTVIEALLISFGNTILGKIAVSRMSSNLSSSASNIVGMSFLISIALFLGIVSIPGGIFIILLIALFGIIGTRFRFLAYKNATASYVAMMYSLTPVYVLVIASLFLGESLTLIQLIGGGLIVLAGFFVEKLKI